MWWIIGFKRSSTGVDQVGTGFALRIWDRQRWSEWSTCIALYFVMLSNTKDAISETSVFSSCSDRTSASELDDGVHSDPTRTAKGFCDHKGAMLWIGSSPYKDINLLLIVGTVSAFLSANHNIDGRSTAQSEQWHLNRWQQASISLTAARQMVSKWPR